MLYSRENLPLFKRFMAFTPAFRAFFGMSLCIYRNISGNYRQNAREFGIGIIGNSEGIFGRALPRSVVSQHHAVVDAALRDGRVR